MCSSGAQGAPLTFEAGSDGGASTAASTPRLATSPPAVGLLDLPSEAAPDRNFEEVECACEEEAAARLLASVRRWALWNAIRASA
jgi:hypothetical protein